MSRFIVYLSQEGIECFHPLLDRGRFEIADEQIALYKEYQKKVRELNNSVLSSVFNAIFAEGRDISVHYGESNKNNMAHNLSMLKYYMKSGHFEASDNDKGAEILLGNLDELGDEIIGLRRYEDYGQQFHLLNDQYQRELARIADSKSEHYEGITTTVGGYLRRKSVVKPGIEVVVNFMINEQMHKLINMGLAGGFYLLDGLINGTTKTGRFGEKPETIYIDDKCDDNCASRAEIKRYRRNFYNILSKKGDGSNDPDQL
jgi:hypothetical protein